MNEIERKEYVRYRIESARKTFEAAKVLADNGFWNSAVITYLFTEKTGTLSQMENSSRLFCAFSRVGHVFMAKAGLRALFTR